MLAFFQKTKGLRDFFPADDFDGKFKYIKSGGFLPEFMISLLGLPPRRYDRRKALYGRIRANPFAYITIPMIFIFGCVIAAVVLSFEDFVQFFYTNVYLNGIIVSLAIFGILKVFHNSYLVYTTALFFRKLERVMYKDHIEENDLSMLRKSLENQGRLVNTLQMTKAIDNIEEFGHPNFDGNASRLIKSKLGFRVARNKANVGFIAGILVMLGLLGTFLGLLKTIDAVGAAMNSMSNIGGDGTGEVGLEEMTGFISSLSAPLQGMGLAFSTSLFGLSGSLLIGFFTFLGGTPQNEFMENVSRWIDNREIKFDPKIKKDSKVKVPPKDSDLIEWLSGFVHMSVKTNRHISQLTRSVEESTAETQRAWSEVKGLADAQQALNASAREIGDNIRVIRAQSEASAQAVSSIADATSALSTSQRDMNASVDDIKSDLRIVIEDAQGASALIAEIHRSMPQMSNALRDIHAASVEMSSTLAENSTHLSSQLEGLKVSLERDIAIAEVIENLMRRLNAQGSKALEMQEGHEKHLSEILALTEKSSQSLHMTFEAIREYGDKSLERSPDSHFYTTISDIEAEQAELLKEIRALLKRLRQDPHMAQAASLVKQLNRILKDLNKKTNSMFFKDR